MFNKNRNIFSLLAVSLALIAGGAHAASSNDYGNAANTSQADRQLNLQQDTLYVNVTDGESVRFVAGNQSFVWHFSTLPTKASFNLSEIAPKDWPQSSVRVYVASNPLYRN